jgi:Calcineurin-like phosphoesterase
MPRRGRYGESLMRLQLLSDLHLETEQYDPEPAPGAELLILAGDIDSRWDALERFRGWPQPVLFVAGNHEFDGRDLTEATAALRARCAALGLTMLERDSLVLEDSAGTRIRFLGTARWSDFDLFGTLGRAKAMRAGSYFLQLMQATQGGRPFDADAVRAEALACRAWLEVELKRRRDGWDKTVVVTHFAPSVKSADPRYGAKSGTASFCNADDDLIPRADLWIHGHLHCRHDYHVGRAGGSTRIVCNSRGHEHRGEADGHQPFLILEV